MNDAQNLKQRMAGLSEERFVLASACGRCGLISMVVDLETEVGRS